MISKTTVGKNGPPVSVSIRLDEWEDPVVFRTALKRAGGKQRDAGNSAGGFEMIWSGDREVRLVFFTGLTRPVTKDGVALLLRAIRDEMPRQR